MNLGDIKIKYIFTIVVLYLLASVFALGKDSLLGIGVFEFVYVLSGPISFLLPIRSIKNPIFWEFLLLFGTFTVLYLIWVIFLVYKGKSIHIKAMTIVTAISWLFVGWYGLMFYMYSA